MPVTNKENNRPKKRAPARTVAARENQLIALAVDLAEKQLLNGTASAQVITHYLKLGTTTQELERQKLINENALINAKTDALKAAKNIQELYENAIEAMRSYSGQRVDND